MMAGPQQKEEDPAPWGTGWPKAGWAWVPGQAAGLHPKRAGGGKRELESKCLIGQHCWEWLGLEGRHDLIGAGVWF